MVTRKAKNDTEYEFIKTPQRPFIQIEVTIKATEESQTSQIIETIKKYDLKTAIVKILYHLPLGTQDSVDLNAIQRACSDAHDVIGIIPIHQPKTRTTRVTLKVDMSLEDLLNTYFETKPELNKKKEKLIDKALHLQNEINDSIS